MKARKWVLWLMLGWFSFGLLLESLLGFKSFFYLENPLRRSLWRLAHAHGVLLPLIWMVFESQGVRPSGVSAKLVAWGAVLMPLGFFLGGLAPTETDPFVAVWLAPLGGFFYILGLASGLLMGRKEHISKDPGRGPEPGKTR